MGIRLTLAARYLNGRRLRAFLTTLAIVFGVLVIFGMNLLIPTMMQALQSGMIAASDQVDMTATLKTGGAFPAEVRSRLAGVDGLRTTQGILARPLNLPADFYDHDPAKPDRVSVLDITGIDPDTARGVRPYVVREGRFLQESDTGAALITESLANTLGLKVGDALRIPGVRGIAELAIVGLRAPRAAPGNEGVIVPLAEAQALFELPGQITAIEGTFMTADAASRAEIKAGVEKALGPSYTLETLSTSSSLYAALQTGTLLLNVFGGLALFMGAFIIFNTFRTIVAERRRDIGMLRAIGASRRLVVGTIVAEGLIQGVLGTAIGMVAGYLLAAGASTAIGPMMGTFIHVEVGLPRLTPGITIISAVLGIGVTLAAGLIPALSAGHVTPLEALRPSFDTAVYRRRIGTSAVVGMALVGLGLAALVSGTTSFIALGAVLFMVGLILVAPVLVRPLSLAFGALAALVFAREGTGTLAQNNLSRNPSRAAVTASTTMIALALVVALGAMTVSVSEGFLGVMRRTLGSDYILVPPAVAIWQNNVGANASFAGELRSIDGVDAVATLRFASGAVDTAPVFSKGGGASATNLVSVLGIDPVEFPRVSALSFTKGSSADAFRQLGAGRGVILNPIVAAQTGLSVGDVLPLETTEGRQDYRVAGVASDFLDAKIATVFISQDSLARDFHKTDDVFIQLDLKPGADRAAADRAIRAAAQAYPQFSIVQGVEYFSEMTTLFKQVFGVLYVLFVFLAIPSLLTTLNTLAISVIERTRELGMLRAVGMTRRQVGRTVLAEALLLAAFGTAFGLAAGLYLGYLLVQAMVSAGFPVDFIFPWGGIVAAVAIGLGFGGLAAIIPARKAAGLEIVQALRYE
jgi:putative ABC transport system permease protein